MNSKEPFPIAVLLTCLSDNYEYILYVDFEKDEAVPYRVRGVDGTSFPKLKFSEILSVVPEDVMSEYEKGALSEILKTDYLTRQLRNKQYYTYQFRTQNCDSTLFRKLKVVNIEGIGELRHAVIGVANIKNERDSAHDVVTSLRKALIVDDNEIDRGILAEILSENYEIIEAADGNEAAAALEAYHSDIAVILTDLEMPVCDGYELLKRISTTRAYSSIPVIVTTVTRCDETEVKCLSLGASDFIVKPYNSEVVINRVMSHTRLRDSSAMLDTLQTDRLTGLYTKEFFSRYVEQTLENYPDRKFSIVCSEIENFKAVNDKYGDKTGDDILVYTAESILKNVEGILYGCRFNGDIFAFIQADNGNNTISSEITEKISAGSPVTPVSVKFGIYKIEENIPVLAMVDRAILAVKQIKNIYGTDAAVYDDKIRAELVRQNMIVDSMDTALREHQFSVYFQPKHELESDRVCGAEALVRWTHPVLGEISPAEFIPLFEKNGFIVKLDEYVLNECCAALSGWRCKNYNDIHVSVNISRRDFEDDGLADIIEKIVDSYVLPHNLIHIEITESVYNDNQKRAEKTVASLHEKGFVMELDDFGTGYSSLAVLNSTDLDVLKLDVSLIKQDDPESEKSALVFASQLAQMMEIYTVAEGIENEQQRDRVKQLCCDSSQGFFYSEALPKDKFEEYLSANIKPVK